MKVSFPNMGNSWPAFKTFFECMGAEVILPDPTNRNDVKIGVKHSPEFVCFPFKTTLGDFVNAIEKGADTLVMAIDCCFFKKKNYKKALAFLESSVDIFSDIELREDLSYLRREAELHLLNY